MTFFFSFFSLILFVIINIVSFLLFQTTTGVLTFFLSSLFSPLHSSPFFFLPLQ